MHVLHTVLSLRNNIHVQIPKGRNVPWVFVVFIAIIVLNKAKFFLFNALLCGIIILVRISVSIAYIVYTNCGGSYVFTIQTGPS